MKYAIHFILLFFCIVAKSGTIDPAIPDNKYVEYGKDFKCVVRIGGIENNGQQFAASAVIIDKKHILTAAHVIRNSKQCWIMLDNKKINIEEVIYHKDFDNDKFGIGDIAIGKSETDMILDFYPELYTDSNEIGKVCSISGFGLTGNFNTGTTYSDGQRRAGSNIIDDIYHDLLMCSPSKNSKDKKTELEFLIGSGDSGGGLFIDQKLAGINSCVMCDAGNSPNSSYGDDGGHTRISKYVDWIQENTK